MQMDVSYGSRSLVGPDVLGHESIEWSPLVQMEEVIDIQNQI
jgi:hypothetical protein